jgi:hypothetical protein
VKLWYNNYGIYLESTLPLIEEEITRILSWVVMGPKTNNDCAGKGQQQFTDLDWMGVGKSRTK